MTRIKNQGRGRLAKLSRFGADAQQVRWNLNVPTEPARMALLRPSMCIPSLIVRVFPCTTLPGRFSIHAYICDFFQEIEPSFKYHGERVN